jgi:hypothetical protein
MKWSYLTIILPAVLIACGPKDKDPLNDFKSLDLAVPEVPQALNEQTTILTLFEIDRKGDLTFIQGQEHSVRFSVRTFFGDGVNAVYNLVPLELPDKTARFSRVGNEWVLSWTPNMNILAKGEFSKELPLTIGFQLDERRSSPKALQMVAPINRVRSFTVNVHKDASQPIILDKLSVNFKDLIQANQKVKVEFTVAASSLDDAKNLSVNILNGPVQPSRELFQFDGSLGIVGKPLLIGAAGKDESGRTLYKYALEFDARYFNLAVQFVMRNSSDSVLKQRYDAREYKNAEATFYLQAVNLFNGMPSAEKQVTFNVELLAPDELPNFKEMTSPAKQPKKPADTQKPSSAKPKAADQPSAKVGA